VRASVAEREKLAAEIEHHDRAAVGVHQLAAARRDFVDRGDDVLLRHLSPGHQSSR
jgi:hypothetical protein